MAPCSGKLRLLAGRPESGLLGDASSLEGSTGQHSYQMAAIGTIGIVVLGRRIWVPKPYLCHIPDQFHIIYPVALRAISATVPTSFFVLCSLFFVPQGSKKTNPQSNNNYQKRRPKLTENHEKVTPGGVPEALGGGLGTILVPRVARRRKRPENGLGGPPPQGPGWGANFDFLSILWCFFLLFF